MANNVNETNAGVSLGIDKLESEAARAQQIFNDIGKAGASSADDVKEAWAAAIQDLVNGLEEAEGKLAGLSLGGSAKSALQEQLSGVRTNLDGLNSALSIGQTVLGPFISGNETLIKTQSRLQAVMSLLNDVEKG